MFQTIVLIPGRGIDAFVFEERGSDQATNLTMYEFLNVIANLNTISSNPAQMYD